MLARLYTDALGDSSVFRELLLACPKSVLPKVARRLLGRTLPGNIDREAVWHQTMTVIGLHLAVKLGLPTARATELMDRRLLDAARKERFGGANAVYTLLINSDLGLVELAKSSGMSVVHDAMIGPDVGLWLNEERTLFPGIEKFQSLQEIEDGRRRDATKYKLCDLILTPSAFTRQAVLDLGADPDRVAIVPFGIPEAWLNSEPCPEPGRILFVGSVGLRKGNHYLAAAARILKERRIACEVRVAGPDDENLRNSPLFEGPHYLGQVPRAGIIEEYRRADVFVLPTICEGFALVQLEALACGVPVITTPNCGSVVRDGVDGFIVPIRDPGALADRIEQVVTDRSLRDRLSRNARSRAREFTWERYGENLVSTLRRFLNRT